MDNDKYNNYLARIKDLVQTLLSSFLYVYGMDKSGVIKEKLDSITFLIKNDKNEIIASSKGESFKELDKRGVFNVIDFYNSKACLLPKEFPPIIVLEYMEKIDLHILIHEINHALHMTKKVEKKDNIIGLTGLLSAGFPNQEVEKISTGIETNSGNRFIYEIINEYLSEECLNNFKENSEQKADLDYSFDDTHYIFLDEIIGYKLKEIYDLKSGDIYTNIIKGDGNIIKNIFKDAIEYELLDSNIEDLYNVIIKVAGEYYIEKNKEKSLSELEELNLSSILREDRQSFYEFLECESEFTNLRDSIIQDLESIIEKNRDLN